MSSSFDDAALSLIEEHVRRLLLQMGFSGVDVSCRIDADEGSDTRPLLQVTLEAGDDGRLLIGPQGAHLAALQHIVRCVLRRQADERLAVTIDVNGYRARRERSLSGVAEAAARRALQQGRVVMLQPMQASDRRMIHTTLALRTDVQTESTGDEPHRRVVVKPLFL